METAVIERRKGLTFDQWKASVVQLCENRIGLHPDDLPDFDYWRAWDSGMSPRAAMQAAIRRAKEF